MKPYNYVQTNDNYWIELLILGGLKNLLLVSLNHTIAITSWMETIIMGNRYSHRSLITGWGFLHII